MLRILSERTGIDILNKAANSFTQFILLPILIAGITIGIQRWGKWIERKRKHFKFVNASVRDQEIRETLIELRALLAADRAYLSMFHNGNKYIDGTEDMKKSRTHEVVGPGVSYENQNYQDIRISLMQEELKLLENEQPKYARRDEFKSSKFQRMLESQGVQAVARCAIHEGKDLIGFIGVDFPTDDGPPPNLQLLCNYAGRVGEIMSRYRDE